MRVLLASGIFYPDVGGPATHVRKIAEHFSSLGWSVTVVAFGDSSEQPTGYRVVRVSRRLPKGVAWILYALRIFHEAMRTDVVYAFDLTTAGMPATLAARILRRPLVVRIGGDPIWERQVESGKHFLPMAEYYEKGLYKKDKPALFRALRFMVRTADAIVVYNQRFQDFYVRYFDASREKISVIQNPILPREAATKEQGTHTFIFAGRFVAYKNLVLVIRAASRVFPQYPKARLLFVGDGPEKEALEKLAQSLGVPLTVRSKADQGTLFALVRGSSVSIAPALSEFNPNFILESLSLGKPILISRGHGLSVDVPVYMEFDPMSEDSLVDALHTMLSEEGYARAERDVAALPLDWSWRDVLAEQEKLIRRLV